MALTLALGTSNPPFDGVDDGQKLFYVFGSIAASGNYAAGGDTLDWTKLLDALKTGYLPVQVQMFSQSASAGHPGYTYYWRPGTTLANGKMQVMNGTAELGAGAYPAAILADTIAFAATFLRL